MKINNPSNSDKKLSIVHAVNKHIVFNFSYITSHKKYSMDALKENKKVKAKLIDKICNLSMEDKVTVLGLPREQGFEKMERTDLNHNIESTTFSRERAHFLSSPEDIWVFRLGKLGRVLGKFHDNIFYIMAIDTQFDLYDH